MPKVLTEQQVESYHRDGFVFPLRIMSAGEAAEYRIRLEEAETALGGLDGQSRSELYMRFPWAHALGTHPRLLDAVEDLIGPDILLYHNMAWIKNRGDETYVSWHQDNTYFGHYPCEVLSAWVALTPSTPESGCMRVLPGTHRMGQLPLGRPDVNDRNLLSSGMRVDFDPEGVEPVYMPLQPGEVSLHHAFLIHGSAANKAPERRIGLTFIYHSPALRQAGACRTSAMLVRGRDAFAHFDPELPPAAPDEPATIARYRHKLALYREKVRELGNETAGRLD